jgi:thiosulfate/3-mercaptopyruvate sulfurtransferase
MRVTFGNEMKSFILVLIYCKGNVMSTRLYSILVLVGILWATPLIGQSPDPWPAKNIVKPEALGKMISGKHKPQPLIIHTGPPVLFKTEHIPGAVAVGQVAETKGSESLKALLKKSPKTKEVVLYCGCCPWQHCPNIRPAYSIAKQLGFKNVKVLDLPSTFKVDWTNKGLPVEK